MAALQCVTPMPYANVAASTKVSMKIKKHGSGISFKKMMHVKVAATRARRTRTRPCLRPRVAPTCSLAELLPSYKAVFNFENVAVFPFWLGMIVAPQWGVTKKVMSSYAVFVPLSSIYLYLAYVSLSEPAILEGFSNSQDIAALTQAFSYEKTVAVGWAHFIAADLFVGRWIYLDGLKNRLFTRHSLLLCLFFGPTGVLSHLFTRIATSNWRGEELVDIMIAGGEQNDGTAV